MPALEPVAESLALARWLNGERSPRAIRQVLPSDQRAQFEAQYRQALSEAAETFDLTGVHALVDRWLGIAMLHATGRYGAAMTAVEAVKGGEVARVQVDVEDLRALVEGR